MKRKDSIFFSGGGTMGSVTPLYAVIERLRSNYPDIAVHWIGTRHGIEREYLSGKNLSYHAIASGKLRRYFSWHTLRDPFLILIGFLQSCQLLLRYRPRAVVSAGGYVAVPLHWAACLLRIPSSTLQPDVKQGLSNKLIAPCVTRKLSVFPHAHTGFTPLPERSRAVKSGDPVNTSFHGGDEWRPTRQESVVPRKEREPTVTGFTVIPIPVRGEIRNIAEMRADLRIRAQNAFGLRAPMPTVLIMGGGTGAVRLNALIEETADELLRSCNIIHITGSRKHTSCSAPGYYAAPFLDERLTWAYASADLVVTRAGIGAISECAYLHLPVILIPLPKSAQETNAEFLSQRDAARILSVNEEEPRAFIAICKELLTSEEKRLQMGNVLAQTVPGDGGEAFLDHIISCAKL